MSISNEYHGDEDELEYQSRSDREAHKEARADDWEYDAENW